jgi:hypothetical protein
MPTARYSKTPPLQASRKIITYYYQNDAPTELLAKALLTLAALFFAIKDMEVF